MTLTDIASNFWVLIPLGLILFLLVYIYSADPPKDKKDDKSKWQDH